MKILWFDTETTGLDHVKNDIVQIAGIIEIGGEVKEEFNLRCRPIDPDSVQKEALETIGKTKDEIMSWPAPEVMYNELINIFSGWINKFDRDDKFIPAGHNPKFDIEMLSEFFKKRDDKYFGSWMTWRPLDTIAAAAIVQYLGKMPQLKSLSLVSLCEYLEIPLDAHDALNDIRATRSVWIKLIERLK